MPSLQIPAQNLALFLYTDAFGSKWSAVLIQEKDGKRSICSYRFGTFMDTESRYHIYEKEILVVKKGMEKFKIFLKTVKFTVRTDSQAMRSFLKRKPNKDIAQGRVARWYLEFLSYNFDIEWIKGENNPLTNALARELVGFIYNGIFFEELDFYRIDETPMFHRNDGNEIYTTLPYLPNNIVELLLEYYFLDKWLRELRKTICWHHGQDIIDQDEEKELLELLGLDKGPIKHRCSKYGALHIRVRGFFGMNWSKHNKMKLLKNLKYGFVSGISFDQDSFEDLKEFVNLIHPHLWERMITSMEQYSTH